ncbi:hypothetical protein SAMN02927900_01758 [Rhizobium mongolense subsp. loessense]|uniref:Uncharacterized protein n=1 Tax=Rhizobium mongolense subsp. loessense TaxID=158890 RepID=A0A1G4QRH1_9HYPH|nr:hypothetical protein SAMN02927900_01758 [Rhizobium mongolense subsp. loessense]
MVTPSSRAAIIRQSKASAPLKEPVRRRERFPSADKRQSCARSLPKESYIGRTGLRAASAVCDRLKMHRQCRSDIVDPQDADRREPRYSQPRARTHSCGSRRGTRQAARPACLCRARSCFAAAYRIGLPPKNGAVHAIRQPGASCGRCCLVQGQAHRDRQRRMGRVADNKAGASALEPCASFDVEETS